MNHVTLFQGQIHTKKHTSKSDLNREVVRHTSGGPCTVLTYLMSLMTLSFKKEHFPENWNKRRSSKCKHRAETCRLFFRVKLGISRKKQIMLLYSSPKEVRTTNEWLLLSLWLKVVGRSMFQPSLGYFFIACMQLNAF